MEEAGWPVKRTAGSHTALPLPLPLPPELLLGARTRKLITV